jgi:hypothetical protein
VTKKNAIGVFASPWDPSKTVMVIFDKDREDGYTPAIILGDWIRKILLSGNVAYFNKTAEKQPPAFKNKYSFEELGYLDRTVRGIGKENLIYRIFIPYNVDPTSADLSLDLTHGPDLDENTSSIAIVLNGYTVASVLPATQSARLEPIQIGLPTKRLRPGINFLRVSFDLHVQHSSCEKAPDSVWATVFNSSTFRLTYQNRSSVPTLNDFPSPFNEYPGATFVVPNQLDVNTLSHVAGLTFTIGAASYYPDQPPKIMTTEKYAKMSSKQGNYILVGLPTENTAIQDVNGYLPQPFKTNANQLQDGYGVFLPTFDSEASTGLMQIINSPWNDNGTVLVLAGTNTQGLDWVWNTILDPKMQGQFSGNLMIVGPKSGITAGSDVPASGSLLFKQTPMVINIPWIGKYLQQQGQSEEAVSIMAIALAGLFTLLALKIAPIISRLEIRFKNHSDNSDKERE